jgi:hypothetical protein
MSDAEKYENRADSTGETRVVSASDASDIGRKLIEGAQREVPAGAVAMSRGEVEEFKSLDPTTDQEAVTAFLATHQIPEQSAFWTAITEEDGTETVSAFYTGLDDFGVRVETTYVPGEGYMRSVGLSPEVIAEMAKVPNGATDEMDAMIDRYHLFPELGSKVAVSTGGESSAPRTEYVINIAHEDFGTILSMSEGE